MLYDLRNPTTAARVIYDGITNTKPIRIAPGETIRGVLLADHIVDTLRRSAASGPGIDLDVTETAEGVVGEEQPAPPATHSAALQLPQRQQDQEPQSAAPPARAAGGKRKGR
jgi:hypothetical protein